MYESLHVSNVIFIQLHDSMTLCSCKQKSADFNLECFWSIEILILYRDLYSYLSADDLNTFCVIEYLYGLLYYIDSM